MDYKKLNELSIVAIGIKQQIFNNYLLLGRDSEMTDSTKLTIDNRINELENELNKINKKLRVIITLT